MGTIFLTCRSNVFRFLEDMVIEEGLDKSNLEAPESSLGNVDFSSFPLYVLKQFTGASFFSNEKSAIHPVPGYVTFVRINLIV